MKQYNELLKKILEEGTERDDRTNTGTIALFGTTMRFNLNDGFPLVTTKKVFTRGLIEELIWMINGDTNAQTLIDKNVHIWDSWAIAEESYRVCLKDFSSVVEELSIKMDKTLEEVNQILISKDIEDGVYNPETDSAAQINQKVLLNVQQSMRTGVFNGVIKYCMEVGVNPFKIVEGTYREKGALGPIYGEQWRAWKTSTGVAIDQLKEAIETIKNRPSSRRIIVSAWNPEFLPDESVSPQENVIDGKMSLAPCHCLYQFDVAPISLDEFTQDLITSGNSDKVVQISDAIDTGESGFKVAQKLGKELGIPSSRLSCILFQRSADFPLGVPFNIASYALLTHMVAQVTNNKVGDFVWMGGNTHIYKNQIELVQEQITREPFPLPTLKLNPEIKNIEDFKIEDIEIVGYQHHPAIKFPDAAV